MSYERLKDRQRAERHGYPENLSLRVHRDRADARCGARDP